MKPLNGYRPTHKNKWLFIKNGILSIQELSLLEYYADIFDFDTNHSKYGTFEVDFTEIAAVFCKSQNTIRSWHNKLLSIGFIEKSSKPHNFKLKKPARYINPGKWKGDAAFYAGVEKDQSIEVILLNCGINLQSIGNKLRPVVKKTLDLASKSPSIALISSKDQSKNKLTIKKIYKERKREERDYKQILKDGYYKGLGVDDRRWIDENQSGDDSDVGLTAYKLVEASEKFIKSDLDLIKEEIKLRDSLNTYSKTSKEYEAIYHKWFAIRDKGLSNGFYSFFIPSRNEPWMQKANKEAIAWN